MSTPEELQAQEQQTTAEMEHLYTAIQVAKNEVVNVAALIENVTVPAFKDIYNEQHLMTGPEVLTQMGSIVIEDLVNDLASRQTWEDNVAQIIKLFSNFMDTKTYPWKNCSNVCLPVLTIAAIQFHARAYESIIPAREVVHTIAVGDEDVEKAERVQKYMNYQLLYKMTEFCESMDKTLLQLALIGSVFRKTYYSFTLGRCVSEYVSAKDLVVPYYCQDFDTAPRKTHLIPLTVNDIRKRVAKGIFLAKAWDYKAGTLSDVTSSSIKDAKDSIQGTQEGFDTIGTPRVFAEQHRNWDLNGDGIAEPYVITVDVERREVVRITKRSFNDANGKEQSIEYFTHYYFLPNPEGIYGLGFGTLLRGLNEAMNTILNEVVDAGSLANLVGGFIAKRSGLSKGDLVFEQGTFKEVETFLDDINKALFVFDFKGPNNTLYSTLGLLYEYAKLVTSVSETMTGQLPSSDTPASTVLALLEEGRKVYSAIHARIHRSFHKELRKIYILNSIFFDEDEYFKVLGERNIPQGAQEKIGRSDFVGDTDVIPVSDPKIISRAEEVMKAQQIVADVRQNSLTSGNQMANYTATYDLYKALGTRNIDRILPKPEAPVAMSPLEENSSMFQEKGVEVLPENDDLEHIRIHEAFSTNPVYAAEMSPNSKNLFDFHRKSHIAQMYLKQQQKGKGAPSANQRLA
jgi:hypothetical protein